MVSEISSRLRVGDVKEGGSSRVEDVVASFIALVEDSVTGMVIVSPVGRFTFEDWGMDRASVGLSASCLIAGDFRPAEVPDDDFQDELGAEWQDSA